MNFRFIALTVCLIIPGYLLSQQADTINKTDEAGLKQGHWIKKYPNGAIQYDGYFRKDNPYGPFKRYYNTGKIQSVLIFNDNGSEAEATFYHPNGFVASKGRYINQEREGKWLFYSAKTENYLLCEEYYLSNKKQGKSVKYYPDSTLLEEVNYTNDVRTGTWIQYYPDGKICLKAYYIDGKLDGDFEVYFNNGSPQYKGQYKNDAREGNWILYNQDGSVKHRIQYIHSVAQNPELSKEASDYLDTLEKNKGKIADPEITGTIWN